MPRRSSRHTLRGAASASRAELPFGMGDAPGPQDLSQAPVVCPICHQVHERCEFRAWSACSVRPGCRNPHHVTREIFAPLRPMSRRDFEIKGFPLYLLPSPRRKVPVISGTGGGKTHSKQAGAKRPSY